VVDLPHDEIHHQVKIIMKIPFGDKKYDFVPWRPTLERVFDGPFAFDTETTPIDDERPWLTPSYVLGAAFNGDRGVFVPRQHLGAFFAAHRGMGLILLNAAFDLDVIATALQDDAIYDRVDANQVDDTQLMHRLLTLGEVGHTSQGKNESTLEHCAATYLGVELPKDITERVGDPVRLSYGKWLTRPLSDCPVSRLKLPFDTETPRHRFSVPSG